LVLIANSCGHTATAAPPIPITLVSQAIHQYGSGQRVLPSTDKPTEPDETSELYRAHISNFLVQGDYAQLETIAERNRTEKGRLLGGFWKNYEFFTATGYLSSTAGIKDTDFHDQMNMLNKWIAAYPQSAATHISLAELYVNYADFAPGSGYANSVSSSQWRLYNERTTLAERALIEAAGLKERDPHWYAVMQWVAQHQGWDKDQTRQLLDEAITFEPGYYHYYRNYAQYLLPRWYGEKGDIQAFAEETSARFSQPYESIVYFQIMSSLACYCQEDMEKLPSASYPKLGDGYFNLSRLYGTSI
jgi:Domain of unknown function (DUF4034)